MKIHEDGYPIVDSWKAVSGARAGALILIEPSGRGEGGKKYWNCKCEHCGVIVEKRQDRLSAGARGLPKNAVRDCGYRQKAIFKAPNIQGIKTSLHTNKTYGGLNIIKETDYIDGNRSTIVLVKCPTCGKIYPTTKRHGTPILNCKGIHQSIEDLIQSRKVLSKNEDKIHKMLSSINIPHIIGKTFSNCYNKNVLPFDFYLNSPKYGPYIIEYDGEQHFKDTNFFAPAKEQQYKDKIKNKYLWNNNIRLIRIPYDANYNINDLSLGTTRFELTKENENDYYKNH